MQEFLSFRDSIARDRKFFAPIGDAKVSLVDIRDLAEAAIAALTMPEHQNRTYDLSGPEALTHTDIAAKLSSALARPVSFVNVAPAQMRDAVLQLGFPQWQADGLIEDYAHYARGEASPVSNDSIALRGTPARSFDNFLADYRDRF